MWCKALIVFAAVSAIAADDKDDLLKKVNQTLDEYRHLYPAVAKASDTLAEIVSSKLKNFTEESISGLQENFSYDDAAKNVSDLEAKAKELGKNISICLSLYNLNLLKTQQINKTTEALNEAYSQSINTIQELLKYTLKSIQYKQHIRVIKHNRSIVHCSHHHNIWANKMCLWEVLTGIQIDEAVFQSEAVLLYYTLRHEGLKAEKKITGVVGKHVASWKKDVKAAVAIITSCAEKIFNGNSTAGIVLY